MATKPHTMIHYTRAGRFEALGRPGHWNVIAVADMLRGRGVAGAITVRHFQSGKAIKVMQHSVGK